MSIATVVGVVLALVLSPVGCIAAVVAGAYILLKTFL